MSPNRPHRSGPGRAEDAVRLHPHRGIGWGVYGTATVFVFLLVLLGVGFNLVDGRYLVAAAIAVGGLALTAFLATATHAMVVPLLSVGEAGISGRLPSGTRVSATWPEVTIDVDEAEPGAVLLGVGTERLTLRSRSWVGFGEFLLLVGGTPAAADRLTPAAVRELTRLLRAGITTGRPDRSTWH